MSKDYENAVFRVDGRWVSIIVNFDLWVEQAGSRVAPPLNAPNPLGDLPKETVIIVLTLLDEPIRMKSHYMWKILANGAFAYMYAQQRSCDPPIKFWHRTSVTYLGEWRTE